MQKWGKDPVSLSLQFGLGPRGYPVSLPKAVGFETIKTVMLFLLGKTQHSASQPFRDSYSSRTPADAGLFTDEYTEPIDSCTGHIFATDLRMLETGSGKTAVRESGRIPALTELTFQGVC